MLYEKNSTALDGTVVMAGDSATEFRPSDEESSVAFYELNGRCCSVRCIRGNILYASPGYQLPPEARDRAKWAAFIWSLDDDRGFSVLMDPWDGELVYLPPFRPGKGVSTESAIADAVEFLLGDDGLYPALVEFVAACQ